MATFWPQSALDLCQGQPLCLAGPHPGDTPSRPQTTPPPGAGLAEPLGDQPPRQEPPLWPSEQVAWLAAKPSSPTGPCPLPSLGRGRVPSKDSGPSTGQHTAGTQGWPRAGRAFPQIWCVSRRRELAPRNWEVISEQRQEGGSGEGGKGGGEGGEEGGRGKGKEGGGNQGRKEFPLWLSRLRTQLASMWT